MKNILIVFIMILGMMLIGCGVKVPEGSNLSEDDIWTLKEAKNTYEIDDIEKKMNNQD